MVDILKIPADDRLVIVDTKRNGFYLPNSSAGNYLLFEIQMFTGRTQETKKKLYKALFTLAKKYGVDGLNTNVILRDVEKQDWGIQGGQPASEIDLGFKTEI